MLLRNPTKYHHSLVSNQHERYVDIDMCTLNDVLLYYLQCKELLQYNMMLVHKVVSEYALFPTF
jgi:hypothetical protein